MPPHQIMRELTAYLLTRGNYGEMLCQSYGIDGSKTRLNAPLQHLINVIGFLWPNDVVLRSRGILNTNALQILKAHCDHNDIGVVGNASSGKCLGRDTPILMWDGTIKPVQELETGELIQGDDGTPRTILSTCRGRSKMFKIIPEKGRPWICNDSHILSLKCARDVYGKKNLKGGRFLSRKFRRGYKIDIPIQEYLAKGVQFKRETRLYKSSIELPETIVPLDPYCYGAWLADGSKRLPEICKPAHTNMVKHWREHLQSQGYRIAVRDEHRCPIFYAAWDKQSKYNPLMPFIRSSFIDGEKRILESYLLNSKKVRLELLAGLLDGDGTLDGGCGYQICTKYRGLGDDIERLCNSLGLFVTRSTKEVIGNIYQTLSITGNTNLIPCKDKICPANGRGSDGSCVGFKIQELPEDDYFGFELDGNRRFLLGDGTVSHNTRVISAFAVADWLAAPHCTSAFVATTSLESSEDRLWGNIAFLFRQAMKRMREVFGPSFVDPGQLVDYRKMIVYGDVNDRDQTREYQNAIKALAFPPGSEGQKAIDTTRGRKNKRVRVYLDELPEMENLALNVRANLSANPDVLFSGSGNPSHKANNPHKELCEPDSPLGYDSVNKEMDGWKTRTGWCVFLSGLRSPNFLVNETEAPPFPFLLTRKMEQEILKTCYGNKNSLEYWRNVIGFWPGTEVELTVLSKSMIGEATINFEPRWGYKVLKTVCGFDTGFTLGGDKCVASFQKVGEDESRRTVAFYLGTYEFQAQVGESFERSIAKQVVKKCLELNVEPKDFGMDISGDGGKMLQAIIIEWSKHDPKAQEIFAISSMGAPSENVVSPQNPIPCSEAYDRRVTEYWFGVREGIQTKVLYGLDLMRDKEVVNQLCSRMYYHKGKKVSIETKKEMKERMKKSPDEGDSYVYSVIMAKRAGLEFVSKEDQDELNVEQMRRMSDYLSSQEEPREEEMFSYSGDSVDKDGF